MTFDEYELQKTSEAQAADITPLVEAHATSHVVKDLLMTRFPQLADVVIHIGPPPKQLS